MAFSQGRALLIGVDQYKNKTSLNVEHTANDIQALAAVLKDPGHCGYPEEQVQVLTGEQATRANMLAAFEKLADESQTSDIVTIFYAGHGFYSSSKTYSLSSYDASFKAGFITDGDGISETELIDNLRLIPAQRLLLIVNACHSGNLSQSLSGESEAESLEGQQLPLGLANTLLSAGEGRAIITACRIDQKAYYKKGAKLTYFGEELIKGFKGAGTSHHNSFVGLFDLYSYLYHSLEALDLDQEPELTLLKGVGPFPLALTNGAKNLDSYEPESEEILADTAVRRVSPSYSQNLLKRHHTQTISGNAQVGTAINGDFHGTLNNSSTHTNVSGTGNAVGAGASSSVVQTGGGNYIGRDQNNFSGAINDSVLNIGSNVTNSSQSINSQKGAPSLEQQLRLLQEELLNAVKVYQSDALKKVQRYSDGIIDAVLVSPMDLPELETCQKALVDNTKTSVPQVVQSVQKLLALVPKS
jgi:hypothetical protein